MSAARFIKHFVLSPVISLFYFLDTLFLPSHLEQLPYDKPVRPRTPTYDGSSQAVHPDILGPDGSGRPFVLALTPYPFSDDAFENPSILISEDGLRFREEKRGINPLAAKPASDHNDDPDLSFLGGCYNLLYLETLRPERQNLVLLRSADRLVWSRTIAATYALQGKDAQPFIVSPALAERNGSLYLYYVNTSAEPYRIEYLKSDRIDSWDPRAAATPSFDDFPIVPWHVDIVEGSGAYYMLVANLYRDAARNRRYDLYIARSSDLVRWSGLRKVFAAPPFGAEDVYRSTAYCRGSDLYVYFSYESKLGAWGIGLVRKRLSDLFPAGAAFIIHH